MNKKREGKLGEDLAAFFLEEKGYEIVERNFRCRMGEIDIIAKRGNALVFVEVKTRFDDTYGRGREAVNRQKLIHIKHSADYYLLTSCVSYEEIEFQVIEISLAHITGVSVS